MAAERAESAGSLRWATRWRARLANWIAPAAAAADQDPDGPTLDGIRELDRQVLLQLGRAVGLSETAALEFVQRLADLRGLSSRLVTYLGHAQKQSEAMQAGIEHNGHIIQELAAFVQTLPAQIAQERGHFKQLVDEVKSLSDMTDTIRGIARQTEILAINAAIEAARAGESGKGFAVLAGEVRRLATQANATAAKANDDISRLVETVEAGFSGDFAARTRHNESEADRLGKMTQQLDESYVDMRQFYEMLMTAVTQHNTDLDQGIGRLLDTAQYQDVFKQIVDRVQPAIANRNTVLAELIARLRRGQQDTSDIEGRAQALAPEYLRLEAAHSDPDTAAPAGAAPGETLQRIELF
ncbi:hypothetical protein CKO44_12625 [Rubrivivax gelatinosus]|uniref:Methyl-accepting transducer domain-containing protein n=1 Tax=Rubrivivax gelatinosus TaxID=28068 RepID=A0ABS1DZC0_RUBGE|nr:hypothetical protein [Rubrivivax gelatinosus]MBK1714873.1 hypothetical protein [Rubrivivax gelatinosus]